MLSKEDCDYPKTFLEALKNILGAMNYTYKQVFYINMHLDVFCPDKYTDGNLPENVKDMLIELAYLNFALGMTKNAIDNSLHYIPKKIVEEYTKVIPQTLDIKCKNLKEVSKGENNEK